MHPSAMTNGRYFFECYGKSFLNTTDTCVVDIGSQDVNGSLKDVCPPQFRYIGVDFVEGKNVDVIISDPYTLPFDSESIDILVSSSCFEHAEMFWLVFLEALRVLKPHGLMYINSPSRGGYHRWPVDCWRFFPDSGIALSNWAKRNGYNPCLLESYIEAYGFWGDFVAVYAKDASFAKRYESRIINMRNGFVNARQELLGDEIFNSPEVKLEENLTPCKQITAGLKRLLPKRIQILIWRIGEFLSRKH